MKTQQQFWIIVCLMLLLYVVTNPQSRNAIIGNQAIIYTLNYENPTQEPMMFGSDQFSIGKTTFNCTIDPLTYRTPPATCWRNTATFQGNVFKLINGETVKINDYFTVTYNSGAYIHKPDTKHKEYYIVLTSDTFTFRMINKDFLQSTIPSQKTLFNFGAQESVNVNVRNNLANDLPGGLIVSTASSLENNVLTTLRQPQTFTKGTSNSYTLITNTQKLGYQTITVRPYITIMGLEFQDDRESTIKISVVPKLPNVQTSVDCTYSPCKTGFTCEISYENNRFYNICVKDESEIYIQQQKLQPNVINITHYENQSLVLYQPVYTTKTEYNWAYAVPVLILLIFAIYWFNRK